MVLAVHLDNISTNGRFALVWSATVSIFLSGFFSVLAISFACGRNLCCLNLSREARVATIRYVVDEANVAPLPDYEEVPPRKMTVETAPPGYSLAMEA